jgi:CNT family concentrative nucleoside transporter
MHIFSPTTGGFNKNALIRGNKYLMRLSFKLISIFLGLLILFSSCSKKKGPEALLVKNWENQNKTAAKNEGLNYTRWQFSADKKFKLIGANDQSISGTWAMQQDTALVLEIIPNDTNLPIDSTVLVIKNGISGEWLYYKGQKVGEIGEKANHNLATTLHFRVNKISESGLKLSLGGLVFNLKPGAEVQAISQIHPSNIIRGLIGLVFLLLVSFAFSSNRKAINWRLVGWGIAIQIVFAVLVYKVAFVKSGFEVVAGFFVAVLDFTRSGSNFLFSGLLDTSNVGFLFAFQVLPTIIFFSALTSLLYYLGVLQKVVYGIAWVMSKTMRLSGAESLSAAANIFLGQTEAPLMVKPYIAGMTKSEVLCVMVGGMATIAGGVLAAYVGFLGGPDPEQQKIFATHLLSASILSAPAAIVAAKMLLPETEEVNTDLTLSKEKLGSNFLEAITNGTTDGVKLAVNVGAMLLVFTALIAMVNYIFENAIGEWTGLNDYIKEASGGKQTSLTFQLVLGYIFSPIAVILGISTDDMLISGQLLGEKTVLNEFFAYSSLARLKEAGAFVHPESIIILTYALCGFSNIASIGIQIGGIGTMAPNQKSNLSHLGLKALIGGTIACFMTATIIGMLL